MTDIIKLFYINNKYLSRENHIMFSLNNNNLSLFFKNNYMNLCVRYGFFSGHKINPKILKLNKLYSIVNKYMYDFEYNYFNVFYKIEDYYHISLYNISINKYLRHTDLISLCVIFSHNINPIYFIQILTSYNIKMTSVLINHIFSRYDYFNKTNSNECIKFLKNKLLPETLKDFIHKNIYVPLDYYGLKKINKDILKICCEKFCFKYDFDIEDLEKLIIEDEVYNFVNDISILKLLHSKKLNNKLYESITYVKYSYEMNNKKILEFLNYLLNEINFIPTIKFMIKWNYDLKGGSSYSHENDNKKLILDYYFNKIDDKYDDMIILNKKAIVKIISNSNKKTKKNNVFFNTNKNLSLRDNLLIYLADNNLTISKYFVIDEKLSELFKIELGTTIHINNVDNLLSYV
jgi:hypothetical protein